MNLALDGEQRIDVLYRLDSNRCLIELFQFVELAACVRPEIGSPTRLIAFGRFTAGSCARNRLGKPSFLNIPCRLGRWPTLSLRDWKDSRLEASDRRRHDQRAAVAPPASFFSKFPKERR